MERKLFPEDRNDPFIRTHNYYIFVATVLNLHVRKFSKDVFEFLPLDRKVTLSFRTEDVPWPAGKVRFRVSQSAVYPALL